MKCQHGRALVATGLVIGLGGCLSPQEHFYTLEGPSVAMPAAERSTTIVVGPVSVPMTVDRPQLVVRVGDHELEMLEQERWATPLKDALPRVLAEELNRRAPSLRFVPFNAAWPEPASARLSVVIDRFEVARDSGAHITAHWMWRNDPSKENGTLSTSDVQAKITKPGAEGLVDALQQATLLLADDIAARLPTSVH